MDHSKVNVFVYGVRFDIRGMSVIRTVVQICSSAAEGDNFFWRKKKNDERPPPLLRGRVLSPDWTRQKVKDPYHTKLVSDVKYLNSLLKEYLTSDMRLTSVILEIVIDKTWPHLVTFSRAHTLDGGGGGGRQFFFLNKFIKNHLYTFCGACRRYRLRQKVRITPRKWLRHCTFSIFYPNLRSFHLSLDHSKVNIFRFGFRYDIRNPCRSPDLFTAHPRYVTTKGERQQFEA